MKRSNVLVSLIILAIIAAAAWYFFMRPLHYCEVVYSTDPHTDKLVVSCNEKNCDKTCYMKFRKKGSEDDWRTPGDNHQYDTSQYEYQCKCK
jgi:hypothetical protein